jgi:diguanylate cyclase (GGDEF)-like protein
MTVSVVAAQTPPYWTDGRALAVDTGGAIRGLDRFAQHQGLNARAFRAEDNGMEDVRTSERLRAIVRTQTEITASGLEPKPVMDLIATRAQELTDADAAVVELVEGEEMVYMATSVGAERYLGTRLAIDSSLSGRSVLEERVLYSEDTSVDDRVDAAACRRVDAAAMLCAPLIYGKATVGVLKVYSRRTHAFDELDVETLELLADLIAAHLAHASLYVTESEAARRDVLTALPNRRAFAERLPVELARAARRDEPLALCLLDLDGFKGVNDRLGHPAGDEVLREVARILDEGRVSDECFRLGGDEFAILMPGTDREDAALAAERVAAVVRESGLGDGTVGVSFGVAAAIDLDGEALLSEADHELLRAKDRLYER